MQMRIMLRCSGALCVVFIFCIFFQTRATAQLPVEFNAGQQHFSIPEFKEGTVAGFDNDFVKLGIISSIKQSTAPVEIRVYRWTQGRMKSMIFGRVFVIKCDSNKVSCITYAGRGELSVDALDPKGVVTQGLQLANIVDSVQYYKWITYSAPRISTDSLFNAFIENKIFALQDEIQVIDSLKSIQPKTKGKKEPKPFTACADCFANETLLVEIKTGEKTRNFRLMAKDYGEPVSMRATLMPYTRLRDFIFTLMYR